jgi:predicted PurR-regulated permease PerM
VHDALPEGVPAAVRHDFEARLQIAIVVALVLSPAVGWLQKLRLGRFPSVVLMMLISIAVAGGVGWVIFNQLVDVVNELPSYQQNIHNKIEAIRTPSARVSLLPGTSFEG